MAALALTASPTTKVSIPYDLEAFRRGLGAFGFRLADVHEIGATLALAERLLNIKLTPEPIVRAAHEYCGGAVWVLGTDRITGFILSLPLSRAGEAAMRNGTFKPTDPNHAHFARIGEQMYGTYCWVYGGESHADRKAVMMASGTTRLELVPMLPVFARGATDDGVRSAYSLGMVPCHDSLPDLFVQEALSVLDEAA